MNRNQFLLLLGGSLLMHILFVTKAIHIDDPLFIYAARQIIESPGDPYSTLINWNGTLRPMADFFSNPPGFCYYLAFIIHHFGENEVVLHLFMWPFTFLSLVFGFLLFQKFTTRPFVATLIFFCSPIFLVSLTNLMPDIALLSVFLGSLYFFIESYEQEKPLFAILSGVLISISLMVRYNAIVLIPIVICYVLINLQYRKLKYLLILSIPILTFMLWNLYTMELYGIPHFTGQMGFQEYGFKISTVFENTGANLIYLSVGSGFLTIFALMKILKQGTKVWKATVFILSLIFFVVVYFTLDYNAFHLFLATLLLVASMVAGLYGITKVIGKANSQMKKDEIFLILWIGGVLLMHFSGIHTASKYVLPILLPFIILLLNTFSFKNLYPIIGLSLTFGLLLSIADFKLAGAYRNAATEIAKEFNTSDGSFTGHWGYQYYLEKAGLVNHLSALDNLPKNHILVETSLAWPREIQKPIKEKLSLVKELIFRLPIPLRTMHNASGQHANFYSNNVYSGGIGILPFSISMHPLDTIKIYRVSH